MADEQPGAGTPVAGAQPSGQMPPQASSTPPTEADHSLAQGNNLANDPNFRAYQSAADQREAALKRQMIQMQSQLEAMQAKMAQDAANQLAAQQQAIEKLDPVEQASYYRKQAEAMQQQLQQQQRAGEMARKAADVLMAAQVDRNHPDLQAVWAMPPNDNTLALLAQTVASIKAKEAADLRSKMDALTMAAKQPVEQNTQQAVVNALNAAGVTATSRAPTTVPPVDPRAEQKAALSAEFKSHWGKGVNSPSYMAFLDKITKMGFGVDDLT